MSAVSVMVVLMAGAGLVLLAGVVEASRRHVECVRLDHELRRAAARERRAMRGAAR